MQVPLSSLALAAVLVGAASYAVTSRDDAQATTVDWAPAAAPADDDSQEDDTTMPSGDVEPDDEAPSLSWTVPAAWPAAPNPNAMRIETRDVPGAAGTAELSVIRAGGDTEANIQRWLEQFESRGKEERAERAVRGHAVTIVAVEGTYAGGMGSEEAPRPGWALLGAIVRADGQPYFFKLVGPAATVRAARPGFESLVNSVR